MITKRFQKFLRKFGVNRIAEELMVGERIVYHWLAGTKTPRLATARQVIELAAKNGQRLTLKDIRPGLPTESWEVRARRARRARKPRDPSNEKALTG